MNLPDELASLKTRLQGESPDQLAVLEQRSQQVRAAGLHEHLLRIGDKAPDWILGETRSEDLLAKGSIVLNFLHGPDCPVCWLELEANDLLEPKFSDAGGTLVAVMPVAPAKPVSFLVLTDLSNSVAQKFGIATPDLLLPAQIVVDRDALIRYVSADLDPFCRPDPTEALEAVRRLRYKY